MLDICEESPHRGGPVHAHELRQLRPKLDQTQRGTGLSVNGRQKASKPPDWQLPIAGSGGATGSKCASRLRHGAADTDAQHPLVCSEDLPATCTVNPGSGTDSRGRKDLVDEEEAEWDHRQQKSGTVGRLVVYNKGDVPKDDIVLRGGGCRHIVVAGIREGGQAAKRGVRAGDRLVSIDGRKDFFGLAADSVREGLRAPTVLVFLGFVGKLQAEVRLTNADHMCGVPARREVLRGSFDAPLKVCEEHVFNMGLASLFLTVSDREDMVDSKISRQDDELTKNSQALFELQRSEALGLVRRAMRRLEVEKEDANLPPGVAPPWNPVALGQPGARPPSFGIQGSQTHSYTT